jgi:hypothetical protein
MIAACEFDHLVVGAATLAQGAAFIEKVLGVKPQPGGVHVAMGTHNLLLRLGARAYLEVIAIDPDGKAPQRPRWFGLDSEKTRRELRDRPALLTWAARTTDIEGAAKNCPIAPGTVHRMSRGTYSWRITIPDDGAPLCDGLMPTLIQWDGDAHPAEKLEDRGCELAALAGLHPAPAALAATLELLGLEQTMSLGTASYSQLEATLRNSFGVVALRRRHAA